MLTANQLIDVLANILTDDGMSKSAIRSYYNNLTSKMTPQDARLFASAKYLRDMMAAQGERRKANYKAQSKKPSRDEQGDNNR